MVHSGTQRERVRAIYGMLNDILWQLESSDHYNYIPGTKENGWDHFEGELSRVEAAIQRDFLGEADVQRRLDRIVKEMRRFVKRFEVPGVSDRWLEIDPALKYFDGVFEVMENEPELYLRIERRADEATPGKIVPRFAFQPTVREVLERRAYFEAVRAENKALNNQFSEDRIFQNEVVRALGLVMIHDFPELFGPKAAEGI